MTFLAYLFNTLRLFDMMNWATGERKLGNVATIGHYPLRWAMTGGVGVTTRHEALGGYFEYLSENGIEARPIWVDDYDLYEGANRNEQAMVALSEQVQKKGGLFFQVTEDSLAFCRRGQIDPVQFNIGDLSAICKIDDKALDRLASEKEGLPDVYVNHYIVARPSDSRFWKRLIRFGCHAMFHAGCDKVIVRPSHLASGEMSKVFTREDVTNGGVFDFYLAEVEECHPPFMLVEEFFQNGKDFSMIYFVAPDGGIHRVTTTKQYVLPGGKHNGNATAEDELELCPKGIAFGVWEQMLDEVEEACTSHMIAFRDSGGRGPVCFDGLVNFEGRWIITEKNARVTAGLIVDLHRRRKNARAAVGRNVRLPRSMHWSQVARRIGSLAMVGNPLSTLDPEYPMFTAYATGGSVSDCEDAIAAIDVAMSRC